MGSLNFLLTTNDDIADDSILFIFLLGGLVCFFVLASFKGDVFFLGGGGLVCFNFSEVTPFDENNGEKYHLERQRFIPQTVKKIDVYQETMGS